MAKFDKHQVKENGMVEYRQPGNTATVRFGKTFWGEGVTAPDSVVITAEDGSSIQDLVRPPSEKKSGLTDEEKAARAAEKEAKKAEKAAEREAAREARKAEREAARQARDAERAAEREKRAAEREAARAEREAAGDPGDAPEAGDAAEM